MCHYGCLCVSLSVCPLLSFSHPAVHPFASQEQSAAPLFWSNFKLHPHDLRMEPRIKTTNLFCQARGMELLSEGSGSSVDPRQARSALLQATQALRRGLRSNPSDVWSLVQLGHVLQLLTRLRLDATSAKVPVSTHDLADALGYWTAALLFDERCVLAHLAWADALARARRLAQAELAFLRALEVDPNSLMVLYQYEAFLQSHQLPHAGQAGRVLHNRRMTIKRRVEQGTYGAHAHRDACGIRTRGVGPRLWRLRPLDHQCARKS